MYLHCISLALNVKCILEEKGISSKLQNSSIKMAKFTVVGKSGKKKNADL